MPYIARDRREEVLQSIDITGPGELNFYLTSIINEYIGSVLTYRKLNEVIGVLECAKLELYRRVVAPYEDGKCAIHGDVYTSPEERVS